MTQCQVGEVVWCPGEQLVEAMVARWMGGSVVPEGAPGRSQIRKTAIALLWMHSDRESGSTGVADMWFTPTSSAGSLCSVVLKQGRKPASAEPLDVLLQSFLHHIEA